MILFAQGVSAQTTKAWDDSKPAWKWTLEERLAKRFDPAEVAARAALAEKQMRKQLAFPWPLPKEPGETDEALLESARESINGRDTPELLTPMELFISLIESAYPVGDGVDRRPYRELVEEEAAALGFGADLWPRLRRAASPYLKLRQEDFKIAVAEQLMMGLTPPEVMCRARGDALRAALHEFGDEAFLRLLYEVVAPPIGMPRLTPDGVLRWEGGCR